MITPKIFILGVFITIQKLKKLIIPVLGIPNINSCFNNLTDNYSSASITDVDGNTNQTLIIGNQICAKTNLNVTRYRNWDIFP